MVKSHSSPVAANTEGSLSSHNNEVINPFSVGQLVEVEARTWPGINQHGGVGRVSGVAANRVSVRYLVGHSRHEKDIPLRFVKAHALEAKRLRDRSMLLGRCQSCGSLRTDCGSCDFLAAAEQQQREFAMPGVIINGDSVRTAHMQVLETNNDTDSEHSSSSASSFEDDIARQRQRFRRYQRIKRRALQILAENDGDGEKSRSEKNKEIDSSNDENEDDLPLKHLVWQESQSIITRFKRKANSKRSTRAQIVFKQQRKENRAILNSSSEEAGEDQCIPLLTSAVAATGSPSSSQDDESTAMASVSSPGTPDYSQTPRREASPDEPSKAPVFKFSYESDERETLDADSATQNEFIQPEGDASCLPGDMVDRTRHLKYAELASFFDAAADTLEKENLPEARKRIEDLENALAGFDTLSAKTRDKMFKTCETLYDELIRDIVRDGCDQCRSAMRKLSSNKLYNKYKASLPRHLCDRKLEIRDFRLAALEESVEELMSRLRFVRRKLSPSMNDDRLWQTPNDSDDGWYDPDDVSKSPQEYSVNLGNVTADVMYPTAELTPLDPHVHATIKRQRAVTLKKTRQAVEKKSRGRSGSDGWHREERHSKRKSHRQRAVQSSGQRKRCFEKENDQNNVADDSGASESESDALSLQGSMGMQETDKTVPELDEILSNERRGNRHLLAIRERDALLAGTRPQRNEVDIATRMEHFLEANSGLTMSSYSPASHLDRSPRRTKRQRRTAPNDEILRDSVGASVDTLVTRARNGTDMLQRELFSRLTSRQPARTDHDTHDSGHTSPSRSIVQICQSIKEYFPNSPCKGLLGEVQRKLSSENEISHVDLVLKTMVQCLQAHGCPTLQELIAEDNPCLRSYVAVHVTLLTIVKNYQNRDLDPSHGVAFELFSHDRVSRYVDLLVVQMVDSIFSLVHPSAWGLKIRNSHRTCHILDPLRDALTQHIHLSERVCRCIMNELGPQSWRHNEIRRTLFVSSVDPVSWRAFLTSSQVPRPETKSRLSAFGDVLPECEIQATWSVLAYFAGPSPCKQEFNNPTPWDLVSQLLSRGALLESKSGDGLPPSNDQFQSACGGIRHFVSLLLSGSLGGLPRQDLLLINIVRRSLEIQGEGVLLDVELRETFLPTIGNEKIDRKRALSFWRRFDQHVQSSTIDTESLIADLSKQMLSVPVSDVWLEQPLWMPSSELARCCLGLSLVWGCSIPWDKPSRQRRFDNAIKALSRNLIDSCHLTETKETKRVDENDPFQSAFSDKLVPPKAGLPDLRRQLFFQETACYLKICSFLASSRGSLNDSSRGQGDSDTSAKLCEEIWCLVSDKQMKSRLAELKSISTVSAPFGFNGDVLRPYVAAKLCALLALLELGVSPIGSTRTVLVTFSGFSGTTSETLRHLCLCLLVAFECSSTGECLAITSSIARVFVLVLQSSWRAVEMGELDPSPAKELVDELARPIIKSCESIFKAVTSAAYCGVEEEVCAVSILVLLRCILSAKGSDSERDCSGEVEQVVGCTKTPNPQKTLSEEDIWGGLDDSVLRTLDLGGGDTRMASGHLESVPPAISLCSVGFGMLTAIKDSMPSKRYTIVQPTDLEEGVSLSPQGKILIGRQIEILSEMLAIFATHESFPYESSIELMQKVVGVFTSPDVAETSDDMAYLMQLRQLVSMKLCRLAQSSTKAAQIVFELKHCIANLFIGSLLDVDLLERVPSCNIAGIRSRCGNTHEDKMVEEYLKYARGKTSSRKRVSHIWKFGENFGLALEVAHRSSSDGEFEMIVKYLKTRDPDVNLSVHFDLVQSLERECLDRVRCIRGLIDFSWKYSSEQFLNCCTILLKSGLEQLVKIVRLLQVNRADQGESILAYRHAKLLELLSCFVEVHVSSISWIFRRAAEEMPEDFASLWVTTCDEYIAPVLRGDFLLLDNSVCRVNQTLNVTGFEHTSLETTALDACETKDFVNIARNCMSRHLRRLIMPLAIAFRSNYTGPRPSSLLNSILSLGEEGMDGAKRVACCFFVSSSEEVSPVGETPYSPLAEALDNYFGSLSEQFPITAPIRFALVDLKRHAVKLLASALANETSSRQKRVGGLLILQEIFDMEHSEEVVSMNVPRLDLQSLCNVVRGASIVLKSSFVSPTVDNQAIALVFSCVTRLARLPAACLENQAIGWLPDWCMSKAKLAMGDDPETHMTSLHAKYLVTFVSWLKTLGNSLLNKNEEMLEQIHQCRHALRTVDAGSTGWPSFKGIASSTLTDRLTELEYRLRPTNTQSIKNVYATLRPLQDELEKWHPSDHLHCAIDEFLDMMVAISSCPSN